MFQNNIGEFAALATAFFWTFTAVAFTFSSNRIGSLSVNFWRLIVGIILITAFVFFTGNSIFPKNISQNSWIWLSVSGFVGIFLGDLFLFKSFTLTGPRVALLIMSLSPPIAALVSWIMLGETLELMGVFGMTVTISGIVIVILGRSKKNGNVKRKIKFEYNIKGLVFAFLGAIGQATGIVFSKIGILEVDNAFVATQVRLYAGLFGFIILVSFLKRWKNILLSTKDTKAFGALSVGAFFGPFLGISFSLIAVRLINPGIVQTIACLTPILIIPFSIYLNKEKVKVRDIIGAIIAFIGVAIFFVY